jgi:hypothetical protein
MIATRCGDVPVEQIRVHDMVLTHRGRWRCVSNVETAVAECGLTVADTEQTIGCTPDCAFYAGADAWSRASDLRGQFWFDIEPVPGMGPNLHGRRVATATQTVSDCTVYSITIEDDASCVANGRVVHDATDVDVRNVAAMRPYEMPSA